MQKDYSVVNIKDKNDINEISYHLSTNLENYLQRFEQIEKGKNRFNFCACFFQNLWLSYQFMFLEWLIITVIDLSLKLILIIWILFEGISTVNAIVILRLILFFFWIIKSAFFGFFGDRLLYRSIKNRVKNNRMGKVNIIARMTSSDKTLVFRGTAVIASEIIRLVLSNDTLVFLINWFIY